MLSGTVIGFISVFALLLAAILLAILDRKEKGKGNLEKSRFLSRMALGLFLASFVGGVAVTLVGGVRPREEGQVMTGRPMDEGRGTMSRGPVAAIGQVDPMELQRLIDKVNADPKDVASRERLGHLYLQQQDFENVFRMAHEALQVNPQSSESRAHMGMVFFAMQQIDQSLQQFDQALEIDPKNLEALLFKGIVQFQGKDDLRGAKETWERFMKIAKPTDTGYDRVQMFLQTINAQLKP